MDDIIMNADSRSTTLGLKTGLILILVHYTALIQYNNGDTSLLIQHCVLINFISRLVRCVTTLFSIITVNKIQIAIVFNRMSTVSQIWYRTHNQTYTVVYLFQELLKNKIKSILLHVLCFKLFGFLERPGTTKWCVCFVFHCISCYLTGMYVHKCIHTC